MLKFLKKLNLHTKLAPETENKKIKNRQNKTNITWFLGALFF